MLALCRDALQAFSGPSRDKAPLPLLAEFPDTLPSPSIARLGQVWLACRLGLHATKEN